MEADASMPDHIIMPISSSVGGCVRRVDVYRKGKGASGRVGENGEEREREREREGWGEEVEEGNALFNSGD